jgi:hypothetical protein
VKISSVILPEAELRGLAVGPPEIIWPQVLDGAVDRQGELLCLA